MKITSMPSFKIIKNAVEVSTFLQIMFYGSYTATAAVIAAVIAAVATTVIVTISNNVSFTTDAVSTIATTTYKKIMLNCIISNNYSIHLSLS